VATRRSKQRREENVPSETGAIPPGERAEVVEELDGRPTTGGSAPGGAPTGLRHQADTLGLAGAHPRTGGALPSGAGGGTGTGAGGLATGIGGIGGTRNLPHGAGRGRRTAAPSEFGGLEATETEQTEREDLGAAKAGQESTRSGTGGGEPESAPATTVRGAGSGRLK
jgi:hypothetical protein